MGEDRAVFGSVTVDSPESFVPYKGSELDTAKRIARRLDVKAIAKRAFDDEHTVALGRLDAVANEVEPVDVGSLDALLAAIAFCLNASVAGMKSASRVRRETYARHLFCYLARWELGMRWQAISDAVNRDHSTAIQAFQGMRALILAGTKESAVAKNDIYWIKRRFKVQPIADAVHRELRKVGA